MKKHLSAAMMAGALACTNVYAETYQFELNGFYGSDNFVDDTDAQGLSGTYYFNPVDTRKGPLAEASFLDRASSVSLRYERAKVSSQIAFVSVLPSPSAPMPAAANAETRTTNNNSYGASGLFVSKDSGWLLGARYDRIDRSNFSGVIVTGVVSPTPPSIQLTSNDIERSTITVGRYIADNTVINVGWNRTNVTATVENIPIAIPLTNLPPNIIVPTNPLPVTPVTGLDFDTDTYNVSARHVGKLGANLSFAASGDIARNADSNTTSYGGSFTLYPTNELGIGVNYVDSNNSGSSYGVNAQWFFVNNASIAASYSNTSANGLFNPGASSWAITGSVRF